jgi:pyruvate formate-lyase activating enzyme-like uncharacterized protein
MKQIIKWLNESIYTNPISLGCEMCSRGSKLVILITGLCPANCFYCPLSFKKGGKDVIYADEWMLNNEDDIEKLIQEAIYIESEGAGITGGDPLIVPDRTRKYIELLKNEFSEKYHIHLYTSGLKNNEYISDLIHTGLDEIRFHPMPNQWKNMENSVLKKSIQNAVNNSADIAIEIPSIPGYKEDIISLIKWASNNNVDYINLNELEFSERNVDVFIKKQYDVKNDISSAVKQSQKTAYEIIEKIFENDLEIGAHYCSSSFKDGIQLTNRIRRRAKNIANSNDIITEEGTILKGIIESTVNNSLTSIIKILKEQYNLTEIEYKINKDQNRIELHIETLEKISKNFSKKGIKCFIIEEYPTADKLEVERIPLQ